MNKLNLLKPDLNNLNTYIYVGSFLIFLSILDVFLNSFFSTNITFFLPDFVSFALPLILGLIGLHFIRIEFTGIQKLDSLNKYFLEYFSTICDSLLIFFIFGFGSIF